jgi:Gluconate 2-dehydrogenase subunit 3
METSLVTRRTALKFAGIIALTADGWRGISGRVALPPIARGYGTDPNLLKRTVSWPRTLSSSHLAMLTSLCDIVLPAEPPHPSASAIGVHAFLDEWMSAPYAQMRADRAVILRGLSALDVDTRSEWGVSFVEANLSQRSGMFERWRTGSDAQLTFSRRLIELVCAGYYTTREGHVAIGYAGNVALTMFPGPPPEVLHHFEEVLSSSVLKSITLA